MGEKSNSIIFTDEEVGPESWLGLDREVLFKGGMEAWLVPGRVQPRGSSPGCDDVTS